MDYTYIGKIVGTHGLKGEIRILSDFEYKKEVFKPGINIYIGSDNKKYTITGYRHHKNYEMITIDGFNKIEDVMPFMKKKVYICKSEIDELSNLILIDEIIGFDSYIGSTYIGKVNDIYNTGINYKVFEILNNSKKKLIPYNDAFIEKIDIKEKKILFKEEML